MAKEFEITVIISTYNRSEMLAGAIESVLEQESEGVSYEVIVVDNNSSDRTREVVEGYIERGQENLRYVFEGRQGVSYARNTGIAEARAEIIAFADDDVRVAKDWVAKIKRAFDLHPEIDCIGGKVLPEWKSDPASMADARSLDAACASRLRRRAGFYKRRQQALFGKRQSGISLGGVCRDGAV